MNYVEIFEQASKEAEAITVAECGSNVMIYPCGFAWITLRNGIKGKRNPLGKQLQAEGLLTYDDYRKSYYLWVGGFNQSVTHKYSYAEAMAKILTEKTGVNFEADSKLD